MVAGRVKGMSRGQPRASTPSRKRAMVVPGYLTSIPVGHIHDEKNVKVLQSRPQSLNKAPISVATARRRDAAAIFGSMRANV